MATVRMTRHLYRFFPALREARDLQVDAFTVAEAVRALDLRYPGFSGYIVDEHGTLRKHVALFVNGALIVDNQTLSDALSDSDDLFIAQALSGG